MFEFVSGLPRRRRVAWDCATGNGQAARGLAQFFERVVATDASPEQLSHAEPRPGIEYRVASAEASGIADSSIDLVTAAQAMHWFAPDAFFGEARRVMAPGAAIAIWGYGDPILDTPELQRILHAYNRGTIEPYWLPERQLLLDGYSTIPFPFDEIATPEFRLVRDLSLPTLMGYVRSWSATARYVAERGTDALDRLESDLRTGWGDQLHPRRVEAPIFLRAGFAGN